MRASGPGLSGQTGAAAPGSAHERALFLRRGQVGQEAGSFQPWGYCQAGIHTQRLGRGQTYREGCLQL